MTLKKENLKSELSACSDSNRIYLMDLHPDDFPQIVDLLNSEALANNYTKLFAKVPVKYAPSFINEGYICEAFIPKFYNGEEDAIFLGKYFDKKREQPENEALKEFQKMVEKPAGFKPTAIDPDYTLKPLGEDDTTDMVKVFKEVFETYPFPIFDPQFLIKSMREDGTRYFGAYKNSKLIAISSAECNDDKKNAEMTDFAVSPDHRGKRLAVHLLTFMEEELKKDGFKTFYTIARLHSLPMNKTFYNLGYKYSGTLTNNTQISGKIESMNVWYKNC
ncbi:putative beta-lysine N-acetyltransferase [Marinilabiliaceae bacterium ANBcel2]|nr:putative beta-lysine N-acetyltransferase [Marinilabiliaceae bacterium ANBcel2]